MQKDDDCPFEATHDVARWGGRHTDGPRSDFKRHKGMLVHKSNSEGRRVARNSAGDREVYFGKHKGKRWKDVPRDYLLWVQRTFDGKKKNDRRVLKIVDDLLSTSS